MDYFYGIVEDRQDPLKVGRVRVRIHGIHTDDKLLIASARAGNVLSKATVTLTIIFLSTALLLGIIFSKQDKSVMSDIEEDNINPLPIENTELPSSNN